jgi:hypothetical protein
MMMAAAGADLEARPPIAAAEGQARASQSFSGLDITARSTGLAANTQNSTNNKENKCTGKEKRTLRQETAQNQGKSEISLEALRRAAFP